MLGSSLILRRMADGMTFEKLLCKKRYGANKKVTLHFGHFGEDEEERRRLAAFISLSKRIEQSRI
jgi:hypothetical protein